MLDRDNEMRSRAGRFNNAQEAFNFHVENYAFRKDMNVDDVLKLSMFKEESKDLGVVYTGGKDEGDCI